MVCRGRTRRRIGDLDATLGPGEVWLCGMWEPHRYRAVAAPNESVVIVVRPQLLADLRFEEDPGPPWIAPFTVAASRRPRVPPRARREVLAWAQRMRATLAPGYLRAALAQRVLLLELLLLLLERHWAAPPAGRRRRSPRRRRPGGAARVRAPRRGRGERGGAPLRRRPRALRPVFADAIGTTFARFALGYRLGGAAAQLVRTRDPL